MPCCNVTINDTRVCDVKSDNGVCVTNGKTFCLCDADKITCYCQCNLTCCKRTGTRTDNIEECKSKSQCLDNSEAKSSKKVRDNHETIIKDNCLCGGTNQYICEGSKACEKQDEMCSYKCIKSGCICSRDTKFSACGCSNCQDKNICCKCETSDQCQQCDCGVKTHKRSESGASNFNKARCECILTVRKSCDTAGARHAKLSDKCQCEAAQCKKYALNAKHVKETDNDSSGHCNKTCLRFLTEEKSCVCFDTDYKDVTKCDTNCQCKMTVQCKKCACNAKDGKVFEHDSSGQCNKTSHCIMKGKSCICSDCHRNIVKCDNCQCKMAAQSKDCACDGKESKCNSSEQCNITCHCFLTDEKLCVCICDCRGKIATCNECQMTQCKNCVCNAKDAKKPDNNCSEQCNKTCYCYLTEEKSCVCICDCRGKIATCNECQCQMTQCKNCACNAKDAKKPDNNCSEQCNKTCYCYLMEEKSCVCICDCRGKIATCDKCPCQTTQCKNCASNAKDAEKLDK